jgi:hypothetical protein
MPFVYETNMLPLSPNRHYQNLEPMVGLEPTRDLRLPVYKTGVVAAEPHRQFTYHFHS